MSIGPQRSSCFSRLLLLCLFTTPLLAMAEQDPGSVVQWRWSQGDSASWAAGNFDDSSWPSLSPPAQLPLSKKGSYFWIRGRLDRARVQGSDPVYLSAGKPDLAGELYLNGSLVGFRGTLPPNYMSNANKSALWLLPPGLLRRDGTDLVALRLYAPSSAVKVRQITLVDQAEADFLLGIADFFNVYLYGMLAAICLFVGFYFFLLWVRHRSERPYLWYALSSITVAYYFFEMGATTGFFIPFTLNRAIAKGLLPASMSALVAFFLDHFKMRRPRWVGPFLIAGAALFFLVCLLNYNDFYILNRIFDYQLFWVQGAIVFVIIATIRGVRSGFSESKPLLAGVGLGVAFGTYDVIHSALGIEPFAWLQGIGFFAVNVSLFVSLTLRSGRESQELSRYAAEAEANRKSLAENVRRLEQAATLVESVSDEVASDAQSASDAVQSLCTAAATMSSNADRQAITVDGSSKAVEGMVRSLGSILSQVDSQANRIEAAADAIASLSSGAKNVDSSASRSAAYNKELELEVASGRTAVKSLSEAMAKTVETSDGIASVVDALEDFAERTNLLAMNTAIEAAHAGSSGKGFAVIATEIKKLASASAEKAASIRLAVADISRRIEQGVESSTLVKDVLQRVSTHSSSSLRESETLASAAASLRASVSSLAEILQDLSRAAATIKGDADKQGEEGRRVSERLTELVAVTEDLQHSITSVSKENDCIVHATRKLAVAASQGREASQDLKASFSASTSTDLP